MKVFLFIASFIFLDIIDSGPVSGCGCSDDNYSKNHDSENFEAPNPIGESGDGAPVDSIHFVP